MNIWEEIYAKHKEGERVPIDPQVDQEVLSNSLNHQTELAGSDSFEQMYYRTSKPQPVNQRAQDPGPQPHAPTKPVKSRFIPRILPDKLSTPYPEMLAKMHSHLSGILANILLETKQTVETLLVCGATRNEGATFIAFHLAMFVSKEYSMKVLYVDTNLHHTPIPKIQNRPGLYSFVSEKKDLTSLIVQTEYPGLYLLPSGFGAITQNVGSHMLTRGSIETLMGFCRNNFDMTIIDGQPLTSSPVMIECARVVDMVLLVCRYGYSRWEVSKSAIDKLQKFGITSVGAILNDYQFPIPEKLYKMMG